MNSGLTFLHHSLKKKLDHLKAITTTKSLEIILISSFKTDGLILIKTRIQLNPSMNISAWITLRVVLGISSKACHTNLTEELLCFTLHTQNQVFHFYDITRDLSKKGYNLIQTESSVMKNMTSMENQSETKMRLTKNDLND